MAVDINYEYINLPEELAFRVSTMFHNEVWKFTEDEKNNLLPTVNGESGFQYFIRCLAAIVSRRRLQYRVVEFQGQGFYVMVLNLGE